MGLNSAIKELIMMKLHHSLTGAENNAINTAMDCMKKQQLMARKINNLQTYKLFKDGDTLINRDEVFKIVQNRA